jgi:DNA-binding response OmpR family regulator
VHARSSKHLRAADDPALSAAILDHALSDGDSSKVYERMKERNIPFITYSGYDRAKGYEGEFVRKPESVLVLVATVKRLIAERRKSNLGTMASPHDLASHLDRGLAGLAKDVLPPRIVGC